jgi:hypothetical protein
MAVVACCLTAAVLRGQSMTGEVRLHVEDPESLGAKAKVELRSNANQYFTAQTSDDAGTLVLKRLPFGVYRVRVEASGFAEYSGSLEVRSAVPVEHTIRLSLASVASTITVNTTETLIDPGRSGVVNQVGAETIERRAESLPGRSLQELVNSQPGWLYEGNAVLHPRGSEYQTQFVVDGVPLTDNRSPGFGPEIKADDVESLAVYTAGFPAEYGRKMGGVVEVNTAREVRNGLHGEAVVSGGSFDTVGAFSQVQYGWGKNTLGVSASGDATSHYLNPVVPENFTNQGTTGDFSARYERDFSASDRLTLSVRHEFSRYEIPNEMIQEAAGQLQNGNNAETIGMVGYQHLFSPNVVMDLRGMLRDNADGLRSNPFSTPIIAFLDNYFREVYFKGAVSVHHGRQEWKVGMEFDNTFLHENFGDVITNASYFDPGTPTTFSFSGSRPALEQAAFVQDLIRLGNWTANLGVRWDHYQLLVNQNAVSPRVSVSRFFAPANLVVHFSYDRIFQTPDFENILLASSPQVTSLNPNVLRLPVEPSHGDYYEFGLTKALFSNLKLDANGFRRQVNNFADDDQLLSTAVSFPIAFRRGVIYGAEGKLEIPNWHGFSGFVSYSYAVGNVWLPVTGGLFLGDEATNAAAQVSGHFADSQDQRNTVRSRIRYEIGPRVWIAGGVEYGSGLPFSYPGTYMDAVAQYGQEVVDRLNFERGRVRPSLSIDAALGADVYKTEHLVLRFQVQGQNLNDRLNVLDFAGLFSGNAISPSRSCFARLSASF